MATYQPPDPVWKTIWTGGRRKLGRHDVMGPWVRQIGSVKVVEMTEEPFYYLARTICYQQLAGGAAATIHGRFCEALKGDVTPEKVLRVRESTLRKAGLSRAKLAAIRDLASKIRSGEGIGSPKSRSLFREGNECGVRLDRRGLWRAEMTKESRIVEWASARCGWAANV